MEEQQQVVETPDILESPIESEETAARDEVQSMKPVQVRLIDIPPDFKFENFGVDQMKKGFHVKGVVWQAYHELKPKGGKPRLMITPVKLLAVMEKDPKLQETQKWAENGKE